MAPVLALCYLYEYTEQREVRRYLQRVGRVGHGRPAPRRARAASSTSRPIRVNDGELWDDTLFMTVLALANMGRILGRQDYTDEAVYQYLAAHEISG